MFVVSNVVFLAVVFIKSIWLVIYARLLGTLVGLVFFVRLLVSVIVAVIVNL